MMSPSHDLALWLSGQGVGEHPPASTGWGISYGREPDKPDNSVTIYDLAGDEPDTDEMDLLRPRFQVRTRSKSYEDAYEKQQEIMMLLTVDNDRIETANSAFVLIQLYSDISSLGATDDNRHVLVANYRAIRERS